MSDLIKGIRFVHASPNTAAYGSFSHVVIFSPHGFRKDIVSENGLYSERDGEILLGYGRYVTVLGEVGVYRL